MFFVDKPYISDFFKATVRDNNIPVVATEIAQKSDLYSGTLFISEERAIEIAKTSDDLRVYTTSENAIGWLSKNLSFTGLPGKIELFKDKLKFRQMTQSIFPDFCFQGVALEDLRTLSLQDIQFPFIIKPTVGFFSMGVYKVATPKEWTHTVDLIFTEIEQIQNLYPRKVLDTSSFIIEQSIGGEEFAIDAYFNAAGEAVILSIFKHIFSSDTDVSDRVYTSSKEIIESNLEEFTGFVEKIGTLSGVTNFPVHIELRRENDGTLLPIEVNPMRFGGWCSTADMSFHAYDFNPYLYYYFQKKPDWPQLLKGKEGKLFSLVVLDNSTGKEGHEIRDFNYDKLMASFEKPIELRKIDYKKYPVFAFLFVETREDNFAELQNILNSDLNEFVSLNNISKSIP